MSNEYAFRNLGSIKKVTYSLEQYILVTVVCSQKKIKKKPNQPKSEWLMSIFLNFCQFLNLQGFNFICKVTGARDLKGLLNHILRS